MLKFWSESGDWANKTFGTPSQRGPLGPLKHIVKEATKEIQPLIDRIEGIPNVFGDHKPPPTADEIKEELYDLQHLIFDVARRLPARGEDRVPDGPRMTYSEFVDGCFNKLRINEQREWPRFDGDETEAVEHKRG